MQEITNLGVPHRVLYSLREDLPELSASIARDTETLAESRPV
jgi:hypothetical protein